MGCGEVAADAGERAIETMPDVNDPYQPGTVMD
jgi:hypothetical protein